MAISILLTPLSGEALRSVQIVQNSGARDALRIGLEETPRQLISSVRRKLGSLRTGRNNQQLVLPDGVTDEQATSFQTLVYRAGNPQWNRPADAQAAQAHEVPTRDVWANSIVFDITPQEALAIEYIAASHGIVQSSQVFDAHQTLRYLAHVLDEEIEPVALLELLDALLALRSLSPSYTPQDGPMASATMPLDLLLEVLVHLRGLPSFEGNLLDAMQQLRGLLVDVVLSEPLREFEKVKVQIQHTNVYISRLRALLSLERPDVELGRQAVQRQRRLNRLPQGANEVGEQWATGTNRVLNKQKALPRVTGPAERLSHALLEQRVRALLPQEQALDLHRIAAYVLRYRQPLSHVLIAYQIAQNSNVNVNIALGWASQIAPVVIAETGDLEINATVQVLESLMEILRLRPAVAETGADDSETRQSNPLSMGIVIDAWVALVRTPQITNRHFGRSAGIVHALVSQAVLQVPLAEDELTENDRPVRFPYVRRLRWLLLSETFRVEHAQALMRGERLVRLRPVAPPVGQQMPVQADWKALRKADVEVFFPRNSAAWIVYMASRSNRFASNRIKQLASGEVAEAIRQLERLATGLAQHREAPRYEWVTEPMDWPEIPRSSRRSRPQPLVLFDVRKQVALDQRNAERPNTPAQVVETYVGLIHHRARPLFTGTHHIANNGLPSVSELERALPNATSSLGGQLKRDRRDLPEPWHAEFLPVRPAAGKSFSGDDMVQGWLALFNEMHAADPIEMSSRTWVGEYVDYMRLFPITRANPSWEGWLEVTVAMTHVEAWDYIANLNRLLVFVGLPELPPLPDLPARDALVEAAAEPAQPQVERAVVEDVVRVDPQSPVPPTPLSPDSVSPDAALRRWQQFFDSVDSPSEPGNEETLPDLPPVGPVGLEEDIDQIFAAPRSS